MKTSSNLAGLLEAFFVDRLMRQRQASRHTVAAYRDTFCLLLRFAQDHLKKAPSALTLAQLDAPFIGAFLDHLEKDRGNSARSRNVRLAAIHSFFHYASLYAPEHSAMIQRVLSIPSKRYDLGLGNVGRKSAKIPRNLSPGSNKNGMLTKIGSSSGGPNA